MKYLFLIVSIICLSNNYNALAQTGSIMGVLTDNQTGETLIGANVILEGTTIGAVSDIDGAYLIEKIEPKSYNLKISYVGYHQVVIPNVLVIGGKTITVDYKLVSNAQQLKEADIVSSRITNTENAVLAEMRKAEQIVIGVSSQQISRTQDRNASEVVRRLPGVTIMDDRFIMIRGLSERYNAVMLNNALAPSAEPDKKAFSFDLIPSNMLDRIMIYKSGAPELPGEFAGGVIKVYTKSSPDEDYITASYTVGVRTGTTNQDFYRSSKSSTDWLGTAGGTRDLPSSFPKSLSSLNTTQQVNVAKDLPNTWTSVKQTAPIDQRFNLGFGKILKFGKIKASNVTNLNYSNTFENREGENLNYNAYDLIRQQSDTIYSFNDNTYSDRVNWGLLHNWSFIFSPRHKIEFRNLINQNGVNSTTIRTGTNFEEGNAVKNYAFRYFERTVYSGQLAGNHQYNQEKTEINWTAGYSYTRTKEPDFRRIRTFNSLLDNQPDYVVQINTTASQQDAGRFYSQLNENLGMLSVDLDQELFKLDEVRKVKLKVGTYNEYKVRDFGARWTSYKRSNFDNFDYSLLNLPIDQIFSSQNINDSTGFKLDEGTNPTDKYAAFNILSAGYASISYPISNRVNLSGGARVEYNQQNLTSKDNNNNALEVDNVILSVLPSLNLSVNLTTKSLIRFSYYRTLNRPEFREIAPYSYYDFVYNNVLYGNINLKVPTIDNFDTRFEYYPSAGELISIGLFSKNFKNPIEQYFEPGAGSGGTRNFIYGNADNATSYGIEFEIKKSLQPIFKSGFMSRLAVGLNTSIIKSNVDLGAKTNGQAQNRPMMGQSPYAINTGIFYNQPENNLQFNIQYNVIGRRIFLVGSDGTPDVYELPRNVIDFSISKGIGKNIEIKAGVQDILNQKFLLKQDSNQDNKIDSSDEVILSYRRGTSINLGFTVRY